MPISFKRVYERPSSEDGKRILVDRLWPRGLKKDEAKIDEWLREVAPSTELRTWYGHDPAKWSQFKEKYWKELDKRQEIVQNSLESANRIKSRLCLLPRSKNTTMLLH